MGLTITVLCIQRDLLLFDELGQAWDIEESICCIKNRKSDAHIFTNTLQLCQIVSLCRVVSETLSFLSECS